MQKANYPLLFLRTLEIPERFRLRRRLASHKWANARSGKVRNLRREAETIVSEAVLVRLSGKAEYTTYL
jgi:hypothetical protein